MSVSFSLKKRFSATFSLEAAFETGKGCLGILGASGSGKSVTLRCLAGIETPDEGHIAVNGRVLFDSRRKINLRPQARNLGFLFQHYALFPTMTALGNITAALTGAKKENRKKARDWLARFDLSGLEDHYPSQLSGGQRQRTALARMLIREPEAILLDEPFSALDSGLRERMRIQLLNTLERFGAGENTILVTHSRDEAYTLCKDVVIMDNGRVAEAGDMKELFRSPRTVQGAILTGCKNISPVHRTGPYSVFAQNWGMELRTSGLVGEDVTHAGIRAHDIAPVRDTEAVPSYNSLRPRPIRHADEPFEKVLLFANAGARTPEEEGEIWWKQGKTADTLPEAFFFPPDSVLLLRSSPSR